MQVRIATRKSELALWQANYVAAQLRKLPEVDGVELVPLSTRGDMILDRSLDKVGGKGLFIKELEIAMQRGHADIAVHSMKDVPGDLADEFCIAALLERANPFDALISRNGAAIGDLPRGAVIGSSSLRRQAQILALRPDLAVEPLRGNVNTRLARLDRGDFDAIVLACAGLERLGLAHRISEQFTAERMLPATAQGVIGIECRSSRTDLGQLLAALDHEPTRHTTLAERAVARGLQASCHSPVASYCLARGNTLSIVAMVAAVDGSRLLNGRAQGPCTDAESLGADLARQLLELGAADLLQDAGT